MARKREPIVNKMYEWELNHAGQTRIWKCLVGEDECITYEDDRECERIKIENKEQKLGVIQINGEVTLFGDKVPFQLENGVPFIRLLNGDNEMAWVLSDTTREDRIRSRSRQVKRDAYLYIAIGAVMMLLTAYLHFGLDALDEWSIVPVFGIFVIATSIGNLIRLKRELEALGHYFSFNLDEC